jgi:hypothetical protein
MEMPLIIALATAYYFVFHYYRHCTIWVLLSSICLQVSDSGSSENLARFVSPLFIMLHYYALSVKSEQLELAAIAASLGVAIVTSPAFKNEVVLPDARPAANAIAPVAASPKEAKEAARSSSPQSEASSGRRVEIITPSQPQPVSSAVTPGKSILKAVRAAKAATPETAPTPKSASKSSSSRRKSGGGGVNGMDADVLEALTSAASTPADDDVAPATATKTNKRRQSSSRSASGEDLLAQARAAARAEVEAAATQAAAAVATTAAKRGAKRRAPVAEEAPAEAMQVDNEEEDAPAPSPKKLRPVRKRAAKMDL